jgi:hypothetical protein
MTDDQMCKSCGMPMRSDEDHGGAKPENPYCKHCSDENGTVYPRDVRVKGMAQFMIKQTGMNEEEAMKAAEEKVPQDND